MEELHYLCENKYGDQLRGFTYAKNRFSHDGSPIEVMIL